MDYRKPVIFGQNWSPSRYQVLPYFAAEKALLTRPDVNAILDVGCAAGWNMSRFVQYGRSPMGLDVVPERVQLARAHGPVMLASGLQLPLPGHSLDVIYIQHVLHHIGDVHQALREARRCLKPGGTLFLVETVEDNPIIRYGRRLYPKWLGDEINAPFAFTGLQEILADEGFEIRQAQQYSVLFWLWEILPDHIPILEKLTPLFVKIEQLLAHFLRPYSAHCFVVASKRAGSGD
jgi:SAM-dependent methyltransferase